MSAQKQAVLDAIDAANANDPNQDDGRPAALLYGERMSAELDRLSDFGAKRKTRCKSHQEVDSKLTKDVLKL